MSRFVTYSAVALLSLFGGLALAQNPEPLQVDIAAQSVGDALNQFAEQSGLQVVLYADDAKGIHVAGVSGQFDDATVVLDSLLASTGLEYSFINDRTVAVTPVQEVAEEGGDSDSGNGRTVGATPRPVMMAQASVEQSQTRLRTETDSDEDKDERRRRLEEIVVTGTLIRGIAPDSSPMITFNREDITRSGVSTISEFVQLIPQNFGGGSNVDLPAGQPGVTGPGFNDSYGSSVNLRGLGSGNTLVLLNGHRLAPSSAIGDFVDISMIPSLAIERIDVLLDGASSIYGGDAVAGVVNLLLREAFEGVETSVRHGRVTEGDLDEVQVGVTGGKNWDSGNALIAYEFFDRGNLSADDRSFSQDAVLPQDLIASQERHSVLARIGQTLSPNIEVSADVLYSSRDAVQNDVLIDGTKELNTPSTSNANAYIDLAWDAPGDWIVDVLGGYSRMEITSRVSRNGEEDFRDIEFDLWAADIKASGSLFALAGGDVQLAIGGHFRTEEFSNINPNGSERFPRVADRDVQAVYGELFIPVIAPSNALPGVNRLELNVSGRHSDFSDFGTTTNPKVGILWSPVESFRLRGSYGTSFKPPPLGFVGATDDSAAVYSTSLINGIFGFTDVPAEIADVVAITVNGTADNLEAEEATVFTAGFDFSNQWGPHEFGFSLNYFDIEYGNRLGKTPIPDNRNSFDVPNIAFNAPESFPPGTVIFDPTVEEISAVLDSLDFPITASVPPGLSPLDAEIIRFNGVVRNLALSFVKGFDFDVDYTINLERSAVSVGVNGTYLRDFQQQGAVTSPIVELIDTQYNPVNLRMRGWTGFTNNSYTANIFINYVDDYKVDNSPGSATIDSWTTVDLSFSYDTGENRDSAVFDNLILGLSIQNVLDEEPPATPGFPSLRIFGYDPTNASPLNRFIAVELTKRF